MFCVHIMHTRTEQFYFNLFWRIWFFKDIFFRFFSTYPYGDNETLIDAQPYPKVS